MHRDAISALTCLTRNIMCRMSRATYGARPTALLRVGRRAAENRERVLRLIGQLYALERTWNEAKVGTQRAALRCARNILPGRWPACAGS